MSNQLVQGIVDERAVALSEAPKDIVARGTEQARMLMDLVKQGGKTWVSNIKGKDFLKFEAWQTIARFNRCSPRIEWTKEITDHEGRMLGYEAAAELVNVETGVVIGRAEAVCGMHEHVTQGQSDEFAKRNACRSMAQTRAGSKCMRMAFSFVAVMAGYEPTPEEEMAGFVKPGDTANTVSDAPQRPQERPTGRAAVLNSIGDAVNRLGLNDDEKERVRVRIRQAGSDQEKLTAILTTLEEGLKKMGHPGFKRG